MRKTLKRIIFRKTKFFALRALLNINLLAITNLTLIERMFLAISLYREQNARNIIKKNHLPLYFHFSLYTNIQKNNSFYVKRYFSSIHNDIHLIEKIEKNINICKKYFLDEHNIIKDISEVYENNSKIYNELSNIFNRDNIIDLNEKYKYLIVVGLPLFGLKEKSLQAIIEILNEGENKNKPISECGIHTQSCFKFINNVLAKNINNYLNEIFAKYKYLLVLHPEIFIINVKEKDIKVKDINILNIDFVFAPSKNLRLLEKKDSILKADIILPIGIDLKSEVRLRFDPEDSNSFSFVCEIDSDGKSRIFLFDERISSETPWFLNNQQLASLNFDDSISEEVFKVFTTYMEIFMNELIFLLWTLRPYKCFKNKDDGYNYCLYYFLLAKFLRDNKFILNLKEFVAFEFQFENQLNYLLNYMYLERINPSLATNFCNHLVEEIDLLIKKQGLYNLLLTYIENYPKYKYNIIPVDMLSEKNNNQISSKEIFDRIELLLIEKFNYKQFVNLIIFTKENVRLYKLILILIRVCYNFCQYLKIFLALLFPRNNSSVKDFHVEDIEKVRADLNNDLIPKIFLHEENIKLFYNFISFFFGELESLFQNQECFNINVSNINEKINLTFYHYKRLTGQVHLYLELYQEIIDKVKQKNNFVDDQENIELNQYFKDVCKNFLEIFVNETKNLQDARVLFSSYLELQLNLYYNYVLNNDFFRLIYHYSKVETLEEKEKSFLEIQKFVHSLPESNIIVSLFQIYDL